MLKSSSLVSVVGVVELTRMAQDLAASTYRPLELYAAAGFIYLVINVVVALFGRGLEARLSLGAGMSFDFALLASFAPAILRGLGLTLLLWVVCAGLGLVLGFVIAVAPALRPAPRRPAALRAGRDHPRHALPRAGLPALLRRPLHRPQPRQRPGRDPRALDLLRRLLLRDSGAPASPPSPGHLEAADCVGMTADADALPHHPPRDDDARAALDGEHDDPDAEGDRHPVDHLGPRAHPHGQRHRHPVLRLRRELHRARADLLGARRALRRCRPRRRGAASPGTASHDRAPRSAVRVSGLVKSFGETRVLDGIDLVAPRGEVTCIIGPSGSGKCDAAPLHRLPRGGDGRADRDRRPAARLRRGPSGERMRLPAARSARCAATSAWSSSSSTSGRT